MQGGLLTMETTEDCSFGSLGTAAALTAYQMDAEGVTVVVNGTLSSLWFRL
jgi:hypothetical protein